MKKSIMGMAVLVSLCLSGIAQANITIETVPVGNKGNTADTLTGYGSVGYDYNIGKYEVTAGQYTAFLNAKAVTDTYGLYSTAMSDTSSGSGITRSGSSGGYTYSVAGDFVNRPVNYVSFWDSCRFANWLGNGQGSSSTETGAYTLTTTGMNNNTITRNAGWKWAVTSEDEWYKAAYYKGGNTNAGYWLYPTSSDTAPGQDMADASGNNANYYTAPYAYPIDSGKFTTVVGEFQNSDGPYCTYDQGGNVWEWTEAIIAGPSPFRGVRGASFYYVSGDLQSSYRPNSRATDEFTNIGFRVSQVAPVPEPSSFIALGALVAPLLAFRRRSRK